LAGNYFICKEVKECIELENGWMDDWEEGCHSFGAVDAENASKQIPDRLFMLPHSKINQVKIPKKSIFMGREFTWKIFINDCRTFLH
jgi:hypothetical protein